MTGAGVVVAYSRHYTIHHHTPKKVPFSVVVVGVSLEHHHTTPRFRHPLQLMSYL
jgi:hypothetical protein